MASTKVKPTLTKGVAKVPVVMQLEALECGAAALAMVMAYYEKWVPLEQVRSDCGVSRDGSNAKSIYLAAQRYGFDVKAYRRSPEAFKEKGQYPCIIHWNMNHFVVLDGFKGKWVYLNDPARGAVRVTWEEFDQSFTGITIVPTPSADFVPSGKRKSVLAFAKKRLTGAGAAVAFVMITTAITFLFGIINSTTARVFMDRILTRIDEDWLYPFICLLILLAVIQLVVAWAQTIYSLKINGKMAAVGSSSYMWKVLRLPIEFFSQRMAGDIQGRLVLNESIAGTLVNTFAPLLLNSVMLVFYLALMISQSPLLTLVGFAAMLLNIVMARVISRKRINISRAQLRDQGKLASATTSGIQMIETIKASGAEEGFFQQWAGYQASVNKQDVRTAETNQYWGIIPNLLSSVANYAVLVLGLYLTMQGDFTLGAVLMFQGFLSSFMSPAQTLVSAGQTIMEMRAQMERVEDVMEYPDDPYAVEEADAEPPALQKLGGAIELQHVTFGYSRLAKPLIDDFSLSIEAGDRIAFVGASGCGKSTLSKLISGLYQPWSGQILFDGKTRDEYPRDVMTGSLSVVDQDIVLFEDTIANNIRLWDNTIEDSDVVAAATDAQLHGEILGMNGGYQHRITSDGRDLSGGQRQRLEITRVLATNPTVIILDEATSALDAKTEYDVVRSIEDRGITCIVIAHRLSTVRDCDTIIVLDHGRAIELGTHEELMEKNGVYAQMVASE